MSRTKDDKTVVVGLVVVVVNMEAYLFCANIQVSLAVNELLQFAGSTSTSTAMSSSSSNGTCTSNGDVIVDGLQSSAATDCALIICGDFNSPPDTLPYQLLSRGHLDDVILDVLKRTCSLTQQVITTLSHHSRHARGG